MRGDELGVEQAKAAAPQTIDQMNQRDLAGVGREGNMLSPKNAPPSATP